MIGENCFKSCKPTIWSCTCSLVTQVFVCTHPAEPPPDRPTASRCPPTTEASAAPASPTLFRRRTDPYETVVFKRETTIGLISQTKLRVPVCWFDADLVEAGQNPGRRRCIRCSSSVYGARTLSPSGSPAPHRLSPAASGVAVDTCRSSGAPWTGGGWGTRRPGGQRTRRMSNKFIRM